MGKIVVTINGTDTNRWHKMGLRQNPFPQIPKQELTEAMMQLNSLDGDPIRDEADLRSRIAGYTTEFVDACVQMWEPGKRTQFVVTYPE